MTTMALNKAAMKRLTGATNRLFKAKNE